MEFYGRATMAQRINLSDGSQTVHTVCKNCPWFFLWGGGEEAIISPILPSPICIHPKLGCVYLFTMIVDVLYLLIYTIKSWCIESVPLSKWFLSVDKFIINYINITLESQRHKKTNTISSVHRLWVTFSFKGLSKTWHKCLSYVVIFIIIMS